MWRVLIVPGLLSAAVLAPTSAHAQRFEVEPHLGVYASGGPQMRWSDRVPYSGTMPSYIRRLEYRHNPGPVAGARGTLWLSPSLGVQTFAGYGRTSRETRESAFGGTGTVAEYDASLTTLGLRLAGRMHAPLLGRLSASAGVARVTFGGQAYSQGPMAGGEPQLVPGGMFGPTFALGAERGIGHALAVRLALESLSYSPRFEGEGPDAELEQPRQHDFTLSAGLTIALPRPTGR